MVAITTPNISIVDNKNIFSFSANVGAIFPGTKSSTNNNTILIPHVDRHQNGKIGYANVNKKDSAAIPLAATPHNFVSIISSLLGRTYGWEGMHFYNDCSSELQSLYTPFGLWLPRDTGPQTKAGYMVDKSALSPEHGLNYLIENGKKFTTLIYFSGHIMLYLGAYPDPSSNSKNPVPLSYQNAWALAPKDRSYRAMIGRSLLFPLLTKYPEDEKLNSFVTRKEFQLIYLDKP